MPTPIQSKSPSSIFRSQEAQKKKDIRQEATATTLKLSETLQNSMSDDEAKKTAQELLNSIIKAPLKVMDVSKRNEASKYVFQMFKKITNQNVFNKLFELPSFNKIFTDASLSEKNDFYKFLCGEQNLENGLTLETQDYMRSKILEYILSNKSSLKNPKNILRNIYTKLHNERADSLKFFHTENLFKKIKELLLLPQQIKDWNLESIIPTNIDNYEFTFNDNPEIESKSDISDDTISYPPAQEYQPTPLPTPKPLNLGNTARTTTIPEALNENTPAIPSQGINHELQKFPIMGNNVLDIFGHMIDNNISDPKEKERLHIAQNGYKQTFDGIQNLITAHGASQPEIANLINNSLVRLAKDILHIAGEQLPQMGEEQLSSTRLARSVDYQRMIDALNNDETLKNNLNSYLDTADNSESIAQVFEKIIGQGRPIADIARYIDILSSLKMAIYDPDVTKGKIPELNADADIMKIINGFKNKFVKKIQEKTIVKDDNSKDDEKNPFHDSIDANDIELQM